MKFLCLCSKLAIWWQPTRDYYPYFCDDCVPRGCSCNFDLKEGKDPSSENEGDYFEVLDESERKKPCIEYFYDIDGFNAQKDEVEFFKNRNIEYKLDNFNL